MVKLEEWNEWEKEFGSNYVSQFYINKYQKEIDKLKYPKKQLDSEKNKIDWEDREKGQHERMVKRIKQLKRKKKKQFNWLSWTDQLQLDCYIELYGNVKI
jgi:1,4-alpha-glucan branching enzyme